MNASEFAVVIFLPLVAIWLIAAAMRHQKQRAMSQVYLEAFGKLCEEDTVDIRLLEAMNNIFALSCRYCVAATVFLVTARFHFDGEYRRKVDNKAFVDVKRLSPAVKIKIIATYQALFLFASYSIPMVGWIIRIVIYRAGERQNKTGAPGLFLTAGSRVLYA